MNLHLERRLAPRRNTNISARIVYDSGRTTRDCVVRNTSDTGARIEIGSVSTIPNTFDLLVPGHRPQHCRVVWRTLREIGLEYQKA